MPFKPASDPQQTRDALSFDATGGGADLGAPLRKPDPYAGQKQRELPESMTDLLYATYVTIALKKKYAPDGKTVIGLESTGEETPKDHGQHFVKQHDPPEDAIAFEYEIYEFVSGAKKVPPKAAKYQLATDFGTKRSLTDEHFYISLGNNNVFGASPFLDVTGMPVAGAGETVSQRLGAGPSRYLLPLYISPPRTAVIYATPRPWNPRYDDRVAEVKKMADKPKAQRTYSINRLMALERFREEKIGLRDTVWPGGDNFFDASPVYGYWRLKGGPERKKIPALHGGPQRIDLLS